MPATSLLSPFLLKSPDHFRSNTHLDWSPLCNSSFPDAGTVSALHWNSLFLPSSRLVEALFAYRVHGVLLVFVQDLHRKDAKVLVHALWSTGSVTAKEPLDVHCSGTRDTLLHFFFCDLFLDSLYFHLGAFTVSLFDGLFPCVCAWPHLHLWQPPSSTVALYSCTLIMHFLGNSPLSSRVSCPSKSTDLSVPSSRRLKNFSSLSLFSSRDLFLFFFKFQTVSTSCWNSSLTPAPRLFSSFDHVL